MVCRPRASLARDPFDPTLPLERRPRSDAPIAFGGLFGCRYVRECEAARCWEGPRWGVGSGPSLEGKRRIKEGGQAGRERAAIWRYLAACKAMRCWEPVRN
eukprot:1852378-Pyramimonas_sp.AAC.1